MCKLMILEIVFNGRLLASIELATLIILRGIQSFISDTYIIKISEFKIVFDKNGLQPLHFRFSLYS